MPPRQPPRKAKRATIVEDSTVEVAVAKAKGTSKVESKARVSKRKVAETIPEPDLASEGESKPVKKRKAAVRVQVKEEEEDSVVAEEPKSAPKKRRTAKAKPEDVMPLAERTAIASLKKAMYIGAHVSSAGGMVALSTS
jgi:AP endonuclease-1